MKTKLYSMPFANNPDKIAAIKLGIVDDHLIFRDSMTALVRASDRIETVVKAGNGQELLDQLPVVGLDVLLLDLQMPVLNGFETCKIVRARYPEIKILILSELSARASIHKVMEADAHGFLSKHCSGDELISAIKSVRLNDFYLGRDLGAAMKDIMAPEKNGNKPAEDSPANISDRELEIIRLACQELSNVQIGEQLGITMRTVETHKARMLQKTGCKSFMGVVLYAVRQNLISREEL